MSRFGICLAALFCAVCFVPGGSSILADDKTDVEKELRKFQGVWTIESMESGGKKIPAEAMKDVTLIFEGDKYTVKNGKDVIQVGTQKLDASKSPKTLDGTVTEGFGKGAVMPGIYEIDGDTLKVCFDEAGKKRPTEFKTASGSQTTLVVYKRAKK
jgi:uncharacterized protein (TIGR03067 family)